MRLMINLFHSTNAGRTEEKIKKETTYLGIENLSSGSVIHLHELGRLHDHLGEEVRVTKTKHIL